WLEQRLTKHEILELSLNQVPYAANRRGVQSAANYYFNRDLGTLSRKEMLALAVLVRAPSRLDLLRAPEASEAAIARLADALEGSTVISSAEKASILSQPLELEATRLAVYAPHFLRHTRTRVDPATDATHPAARTVTTTLE